MKNTITPAAFCAEYHKETNSGRITFSGSVSRRFCNTYTHIDFDLLSSVQKTLLKGHMQTLSNTFFHEYGSWDGKRIDINI